MPTITINPGLLSLGLLFAVVVSGLLIEKRRILKDRVAVREFNQVGIDVHYKLAKYFVLPTVIVLVLLVFARSINADILESLAGYFCVGIIFAGLPILLAFVSVGSKNAVIQIFGLALLLIAIGVIAIIAFTAYVDFTHPGLL